MVSLVIDGYGDVSHELAIRRFLWSSFFLHHAPGEGYFLQSGSPRFMLSHPSLSHPTDEDLSAGTPAFHPTDEDLSAGTPDCAKEGAPATWLAVWSAAAPEFLSYRHQSFNNQVVTDG